MTQGIRVGDVEIVALGDGESDTPGRSEEYFRDVREEQWDAYHERYPEGFSADRRHLHIQHRSYLLRSQGTVILVDTGIGPGPVALFPGWRGQLLQRLVSHGVGREDVDVVVNTHCHFDHIGWNCDDEGRPTFPRARYWMHGADAASEDLPERHAVSRERNVVPLMRRGLLHTFDAAEPITSEVIPMSTPGHTPGHVAILVSSGGRKAVIAGDSLISPAQVGQPNWAWRHDWDGNAGVRSRHAILQAAQEEDMLILACHFPAPFNRLVEEDGRCAVRPV